MRIGGRDFPFGTRTFVMGILNVTPDSFSDGGKYRDPDAAVARGRELARQGADLIDVGGESTRPGAAPVPLDEELRRVVPVIRALSREVDVPLSIDTSKARVAAAALEAGAALINDVTALRGDPEMVRVAREARCPVILMHMHGTPRTMQENPVYREVVADILEFLQERMAAACEGGLAVEQLLVDPGIGFGKTLEHNLEILSRLDAFRVLGRPIVVGTSRKSFIGALTGRPVEQRIFGTAASVALAVARGADVVRVHDAEAMVDVVKVADALVRR